MPHVRSQFKNGHRQWAVDARDVERGTKFFSTRERADDWLARVIPESRQARDPDLDPNITFRDYALHHFFPVVQIEDETRTRYEGVVKLRLLPTLGAIRVRDLRRKKLKAFLVAQLEAGYARGTVKLTHAILSTILSAAVEDEVILANPAANLVKGLKLRPKAKVRSEMIKAKALNRKQRDTFLAEAARRQPWWAPMWQFQALTGLRPGEVYGLSEEKLDLDAGTARIDHQITEWGRLKPHTKQGHARDIDLSAGTVVLTRKHLVWRKAETLRRWREVPAALFPGDDGGHPNANRVRKAFGRVVKWCRKADPTFPLISPHGLRHTYASVYLTESEHPDMSYLQRMMGHSSIKETVDTYGSHGTRNRKGHLDALDPVPQAARRARGAE